MIRRVCALLLSMILLFGTALADTAGLDWAAGGYLDGYGDVQFHMTADIASLTPYGEGTIDMMNALLDNLSVAARMSEAQTEVNFCAAGDPIVSLTEAQTEDGAALTTSLLPNRTLTSSQSALDGFSGFEQEESQFDFFAAIQQVETCYQELTDAIKPYAEEKAASYTIKNVGASRWSRIARLTPEQGAELVPLVAKVLGCGMDQAFCDQLNQMELQKGFIVGLYQTKEGGDDLAVYIKGNALFPDGAQRAISYQWAFAVNDKGQRVDTYKFDMTKNKTPRDNREISASCKRSTDDKALLVDSQSKAIIRDPETNIVTTTTLTCDLSGKDGAIKGSVSNAVRTAQGETGSTTTLTITPDLQLVEADGAAALTGSAHIEQTTGKTVHVSMDLLFDEKAADDFITAAETGALFVVVDDRLPQSSLTQNLDWEPDEPEDYLVGNPPTGYTAYTVPEEETTVDLDTISADELAALTDELSQRLAGHLLVAIAKLPEEATALIRDSLSESDYAAFLELLAE